MVQFSRSSKHDYGDKTTPCKANSSVIAVSATVGFLVLDKTLQLHFGSIEYFMLLWLLLLLF
jgi:hypothetical protein